NGDGAGAGAGAGTQAGTGTRAGARNSREPGTPRGPLGGSPAPSSAGARGDDGRVGSGGERHHLRTCPRLGGSRRGGTGAARPGAGRRLWQVAGRRMLPPLRTMLEDSSGPVRVAVLEVFGESGDPSAIEVAHSVLEHDSSPVVRATAIQVIGRAGLDQRTASLAQALDDPDPDVRATAVELLPQGMAGQAG